MARAHRSYADRPADRVFAGIDVTEPVAGHYRFRFHGGAVRGVVKLWFGPPLCPETGEEMDRGWRWQARVNGEPAEFDDCWPKCAGEPVTEADYRDACNRQAWAREQAPDSAYADPSRRIDPLSASEPMPF